MSHYFIPPDAENLPPLAKAAAEGQYEVVSRLLDNGEDVNKLDKTGYNSLMLAASKGHDEIVVRLLRAGANVRKQDRDGRTALHHACVSGHLEVVRTLMNKEPSLVNQGDEVEHTPLMLAASQGHLRRVHFLTTMPVTEVNMKSKNQRTALHLDCFGRHAHVEVVDVLLHAGASIDACDESGLTPLMLAASEGHDRIVVRLLRAGANVRKQDRYGRTVLHHACMSGHPEVVRTLMIKDPSFKLVNEGDEVKHTPLMLAAGQGHLGVVHVLTTMPVTEINKKSKNQRTALHLACLGRHAHVQAIELLLNAGASIDECDESGLTPLMLAASEGHAGIVTHLLSTGANVQKQDSEERTALHHACVSGHLEVVHTLMNKEPSLVNQGNEVEHTPQMLAASHGHFTVVRLILTIMSVTAEVSKQSKNQRTALHLACFGRHAHVEVVDVLLNAGASIDECDESGLTPLMLAASEGHDRIVVRLLRAGANVRKQDRYGRTALHHACMSGHLEVVRTLMIKDPACTTCPRAF